MVRYAHWYFMAGAPDRIREAAPRHIDYWHSIGLTGYAGGPFADRSGGLITFEAVDESAARAAVDADPFVRKHLLGDSWLKPWQPIGAPEPIVAGLQTSAR